MTDTTTNVKTLLLTQAQALRAQADVLEAQAKALPDGDAGDPWLDLESPDVVSTIGANTARSWVKSGRLKSSTAERGRYIFRKSWLDAAIEASPVQPRTRKAKPAADLDAWEAEQERELRVLQGGRRK